MTVSEHDVLKALARLKLPGFTTDLVAAGVVKDVTVNGGVVRARLELGLGDASAAERLESEAREAVEAVEGVSRAEIRVESVSRPAGLRVQGQPSPAPTPPPAELDETLVPGVKHSIAVASGKGGVGKSTVAVNLAVALARQAKVGLLDADIYGPSIPLMMGVDERPRLDKTGSRIVPFERHGVRFMSLGFMVDRDSAVIWRGPMVMKAVEQLLRDVAWGELDVLVVDLPPGTGDAQLTLSQRVRLAGAIVVTTPQDVALADAIKGVTMFRRVGVPVLGIVENMSYFACPHCGERTEIFGHGGGRSQAKRLGVPFLGELAIDPRIVVTGDRGEPFVAADGDSPQTHSFVEIAGRVLESLRAPHGAGTGTEAAALFDRIKRGWSRNP